MTRLQDKTARLDYFDSAFFYIYNLRDQLKRAQNRYKFRYIPNPNNGRIDVQPISDWRIRTPPKTVDFDRKIYLTLAFNPTDGAEEIILDIALRIRSTTIAVVARVVLDNKVSDLLADTSNVNEGSENLIVTQTMSHLREALEKWRKK